MSERINLADPDFEPSDAQLAELMRGAFAGVRPAHVEMLRKVRAEIDVARSRALRRLDELEAARASLEPVAAHGLPTGELGEHRREPPE